jgi:hypothetical protein
MPARRNYLFRDGDLAATLDSQLRSVKELVERVPRDQLLATSVDTLVEHIQAQLAVDPLQIHEDQLQMEDGETKIDVTGRFDYGAWGDGPVMTAGHRLRFYLPFSGDPQLWQLRPSSYTSMPPHGDVDHSRRILIIELTNTSNTPSEWYQNEFKRVIDAIRQYVGWQHSMVTRYNDAIAPAAREAVERRKAEIEKLHGLASAFNIPLVKKPGMPTFTPVEVRKKVIQALPPAPAKGFKREPAITDGLYEEVLANIRHTGGTLERTPQSWLPHGEEGLRDILLASLNGQFEGTASAEAFRKYGKTDICIEEESRAAFVGECKLWTGERALLEALNQLLGYVTWRDVKTALVIFNKDVAGFSRVQQTIGEVLPKHRLYLRDKAVPCTSEWRADFASAEDAGREVRVHVFAFNLYVSPERSGKRR